MTLKQFKSIFEEMHPSMTLYARRILGDEGVEDVVQDSFVELWNRREQIKNEQHLRHFLYKTVYTRCLALVNHRKVVERYAKNKVGAHSQSVTLQEPTHEDVEQKLETIELGNTLTNAINELPTMCRKVFLMSYVDNIADKDIADLLNISPRTVEAHIHKALKRLRVRLENKR